LGRESNSDYIMLDVAQRIRTCDEPRKGRIGLETRQTSFHCREHDDKSH
jgi:hypothetical protein